MISTRLRGLWFTSALLASLLASPLAAQEDNAPKPFNSAEEEAIRQLVREYLFSDPEIIIEAARIHRQRQQEIQQEGIRQTLISSRESLGWDPDSPVIGNPDGDVVVVEFFDYRCPYCTRVALSLREAIQDDGNIRLVMKEFPILGPESMTAARMALAAAKQDKYENLHFALMAFTGKLDEGKAFKIAENTGLDMDRLRRDMEAPEIDEMLQRNFALAESLRINGTPAFVVGDELVPGMIDMSTLHQIVGNLRANSS